MDCPWKKTSSYGGIPMTMEIPWWSSVLEQLIWESISMDSDHLRDLRTILAEYFNIVVEISEIPDMEHKHNFLLHWLMLEFMPSNFSWLVRLKWMAGVMFRAASVSLTGSYNHYHYQYQPKTSLSHKINVQVGTALKVSGNALITVALCTSPFSSSQKWDRAQPPCLQCTRQ